MIIKNGHRNIEKLLKFLGGWPTTLLRKPLFSRQKAINNRFFEHIAIVGERIMVIDTNNINSSGGTSRSRNSAPVVPTTAKTPTNSVETAETSSKDNVVISPEAQNMVRLQAKINNSPDVNMDKVTAIKLAISQGRFEINPERLAENMLKQDELLG